MPRYRLTLAYDGTDFHGWQRNFQPASRVTVQARRLDPLATDPLREGEPFVELRTVQGVLLRAVRAVVRAPVEVTGASRTDTGVHARAQTASFMCPDDTPRPPDDRLMLALNARLPDDVLITACRVVEDDFDPITSCLVKGYRYRLHDGRDRPLWERRTVHHVPVPLDDRSMADAAALFEGSHDFAAFAQAGHGRESTRRNILNCRVERTDEHALHIDIAADGFLWNMVRIIAGTLVEVGKGRLPSGDIIRALETGDRRAAGPTLPPTGLCLMWSLYPGDDLAQIARENELNADSLTAFARAAQERKPVRAERDTDPV